MNGLNKGLALLLLVGGCAQGPAGTASFSAVSKKIMDSKRVEVVAELDVSMCSHNALIVVAWGEQPNHEYLLRTALDEHDADALTNARLDFTSLPLLLYNQSCARLRGDLVRLTPGADAGGDVESESESEPTSADAGGEPAEVAP
jgi:hypothetical protein